MTNAPVLSEEKPPLNITIYHFFFSAFRDVSWQTTPNRSFRNLDHMHESAKEQKATTFMKILILTNLPNYSP